MNIKIIEREFYQHSRHFNGRSPATIRRYEFVISSYVRFAKVETMGEVTEDNVRALFLHGRAERNWKPNTFRVYHKSLGVFFRWCMGKGYIPFNPLRDIEMPKLGHALPKGLTKQQALYLLEVVQNYPYEFRFLRCRNHAIFSMLLFAGLRKGELLNLKYSDIDLENQAVLVRQGKGGVDRIVPMTSQLAQTLGLYVQERKRLRKTCPKFFASLKLDTGLTDDGLRHMVQNIQAAAKIKFTLHALRHTFATLMLEGGCDIYSLSKMLGHSDIKTTTIYLAASAEHLRNQIGKHPLN